MMPNRDMKIVNTQRLNSYIKNSYILKIGKYHKQKLDNNKFQMKKNYFTHVPFE